MVVSWSAQRDHSTSSAARLGPRGMDIVSVARALLVPERPHLRDYAQTLVLWLASGRRRHKRYLGLDFGGVQLLDDRVADICAVFDGDRRRGAFARHARNAAAHALWVPFGCRPGTGYSIPGVGKGLVSAKSFVRTDSLHQSGMVTSVVFFRP